MNEHPSYTSTFTSPGCDIVVQNKNWLQRILHDEDETQIIVEAIADTMIAFGGSSEWFAD